MSKAGRYGRKALRAARRTARSARRPLSRLGLTARATVSGRRLPARRARIRSQLDRLVGRRAPAPTPARSTTVLAPSSDVADLDRAARAAGTDLVCFRADTTEPLDADWLDRLVEALGGHVVASTALLVHPERPRRRATTDDLLVREAGLALIERDGAPVAEALEAGCPPDLDRPAHRVDAMSGACAVVDRAAFVAAGGLPEVDDVDAALIGLSARLRLGGGSIVVVPAAAAFDHRPVTSGDLRHALDPGGPAWRQLVDRTGPLLLRAGQPARPTSFALTVAAPSDRVAPRWGDWHLAEALARALRRLDHPVRVQSVAEADEPTSRACDVQLVLRGKERVRRSPGQRHVLWVISHPDQLSTGECDEADLVLVASVRFADELRPRTTTPVVALLQATDPERFRPVAPDPAWTHPVTIVANARHTMRPIVADALAAGLRPALIGRGWDRLVDPSLVASEQVPNEELAAVYSSAGVVLNDHWDDMRAHGFVSNRVFDALACAAPLVSDDLPELHELFGPAVRTYRTVDELRRAVDEVLSDPEAARRRAGVGRERVLAHHTFDHRARELLAHLAAHGLDPSTSTQ